MKLQRESSDGWRSCIGRREVGGKVTEAEGSGDEVTVAGVGRESELQRMERGGR